MQLHPAGIQIHHVLEFAPAVLAQLHDVAHVFLGGDQADLGIRLLGQLDVRRVGVVQRRVDIHGFAVGLRYPVDDVGSGGDEVEIVFPFQTLLNDLHVQQTKEAAAEAEAKGDGAFRLVAHGGVVELQLFQRVPQVLIFGAVGGVDAGEHHGLGGTVAGQGLGGGILHAGDGVADPGVRHGFDGSGDVAHFTGAQGVRGVQPAGNHGAHLHHLVDRAGGHHFDVHAGLHRSLLDAGVDDDAPVGIVLAVEDQRLQWRVPFPGGGGDVPDNHLQNGGDVDAIFGGNFGGVLGGDADDVLNFRFHLSRTGGGQVDFIDDGQDFQPGVDGEIGIGESLGFHALGGVHHQNRALAGGKAPGDLVVEVHVTRGVDQIQDILFAVGGGVMQGDGAGFDGDAPLPL